MSLQLTPQLDGITQQMSDRLGPASAASPTRHAPGIDTFNLTSRCIKTSLDVVLAFLGLIMLAPLLFVIALLIRRDGGPALFRHMRIGEAGQPFACLKFRTMVPNSDAMLQHQLLTDPAAAAEWRETQKLRHDCRVTGIGRFLRATSLDELPQLINVLRLEMSLVGPRPIVEAELPRYGRRISSYYLVRPGLTGLWQVSGRTTTSYARRVRLDAFYVENWSLRMDLVILLRTIPAVLTRRGAC